MKPDKAKIYIFFTIITLLLFSCQTEENIVFEDKSENLIPGSPLAVGMLRITQNPTSDDNVIDSTDCFSVKLPVKAFVNGEAVTVETDIDYMLVENIFNQFADDEDVITFQFPVTVVYPDYNESVILNEEEWELAANCNNLAYTGLGCFGFDYPISINLYDITNQIADVMVIQDDMSLYGFISNMQENVLAEIAYPVTIITPDGDEVNCSNNEALLSVISQYAPQCNAVESD